MQLTERHDLDMLARSFAAERFVQVPDFLTDGAATALHQCLENDVPWGVAWFDGEARYLRRHEIEATPREEIAALQRGIRERARDTYQYLYGTYPMLDAYLGKWNEVPFLDRLLEFLNDAPVLELVRRITGRPDIVKADGQATRYAPNHFLGRHTDISRPNEVWVAAYIINLTPTWSPNWGGYLELLDDNDDVRRALKPRYNVLNLLAVPQPHLVSMVTPFAGAHRYAITGWFRAE